MIINTDLDFGGHIHLFWGENGILLTTASFIEIYIIVYRNVPNQVNLIPLLLRNKTKMLK
jgi:hypothetical protein